MRRLLLGLCMAAGFCLAGCDKSVDSEIKDVNDAKRERNEEVKEELREAQDAKIEGDKNVREEIREAEDAKAREAERNNTVPPPVTPPAP
jgi:hypothetical protein